MYHPDFIFRFIGDSPVVRGNFVHFNFTFGRSVLAAWCSVLVGYRPVTSEVNCEYWQSPCMHASCSYAVLPLGLSGKAWFKLPVWNYWGNQFTPKISIKRCRQHRKCEKLVFADPINNFRLGMIFQLA